MAIETKEVEPNTRIRLGRLLCRSAAFATLTLLPSLVPSSASAQSSISSVVTGTVTDQATGHPVHGANVVWRSESGRSHGAATDADGNYRIEKLAAGSYSVTASFVGYADSRFSDVAVEQGSSMRLDIALEQTLIYEDEVIVRSVSRRAEKAVDAPAAVTVVEGPALERPVLTVAENVKGLPAVDVAMTGLTQSRVAVRGFNNVIDNADRLLILTDYRNNRLPSFRINNYQLIQATPEDLARMEIVSGPGSALYGPNAANGVLHLITKSPLESQGTTVSVGAGERDLMKGSFRHAGLISPRVGFKVSGRYFRGTDWKYDDPLEPDSLIRGRFTLDGRVNENGVVSNARDNDVENGSLDARVDIAANDDLTVTLAGGIARSSSINLTVAGAGQYTDWTSGYVQALANYRELFVQAFWNQGFVEDAYLLRTGDQIVDKSQLYVGQIQHRSRLLDGRQLLTYGADAFLTRPNTEFTINGRHEEMDSVDEYGAYIQSETQLMPSLKFVAAVRYDEHSELEDPVVSPRAALVLNVRPSHTLRATYNRAFTTPAVPVFFLDINLAQSLGPLPYGIQGLSVPSTGFNFRRDAGGGIDGLYMQSPFNPAGPAAFIPADATSMWGAVVAIMAAQGVDISGIPAPASENVPTALFILNTGTSAFDPVDATNIQNIGRPTPTITNTLEVGYKGLIASRFYLTADVYYARISDPVSSLNGQSPNVFLDGAALAGYLSQYMPAEQAGALAQGIAQIPLGTITPEEAGALNPGSIIVSFRNYDETISLWGADFSAAYFLRAEWRFSGAYSFVSEELFEREGSRLEDISLNAPRHKLSFGVQYVKAAERLDASIRFRYVDAFPVRSGAYSGEVEAYSVVDLSLGYGLPMLPHTKISLSIQNALDNRHQEFVGSPEIGRLAILQLTANL